MRTLMGVVAVFTGVSCYLEPSVAAGVGSIIESERPSLIVDRTMSITLAMDTTEITRS